jgi:uncharacterized protein
MNRQSCFLMLMLSVVLMSCSSAPSRVASEALEPSAPTSSPLAQTQQVANQGQQLPISAQATIAQKVIQLEVAVTPRQQAMGLMYRSTLPDDRGMLFPFDSPRPVSFWMKNVLIPLDMVFMRDGVVQAIAAKVPPCADEPCATYGPNVLIDQVIELRGGRAAELGLKVGDRIPIKFLSPNLKSVHSPS